MLFMPTCKEAAALLIASEDRLISIPDRLKVRLHMMACKTCPNFERQLLTMRSAMRQWRNYASDETENSG
ncbi:MAG: zf-HC2 domain-containing protein [Rhodoferax sp.]|jgi:hypothetical protein|nr:zf-HC2 domain-containing protein [Rhodoferax sp.]